VEGSDTTLLDPRSPADSDRDPVWHVIENTEVDLDYVRRTGGGVGKILDALREMAGGEIARDIIEAAL